MPSYKKISIYLKISVGSFSSRPYSELKCCNVSLNEQQEGVPRMHKQLVSFLREI